MEKQLKYLVVLILSALIFTTLDNSVTPHSTFMRNWGLDFFEAYLAFLLIAYFVMGIDKWNMKQKGLVSAALAFGVSTFFELLQLFQVNLYIVPVGTFDFLDLIAYALGTVLGLVVVGLIMWTKK